MVTTEIWHRSLKAPAECLVNIKLAAWYGVYCTSSKNSAQPPPATVLVYGKWPPILGKCHITHNIHAHVCYQCGVGVKPGLWTLD